MLRKLQKQPEQVKKIILWFVVIIVGIVLLNFWARSAGERMREFQAEELDKKWRLPEIEMPVLEIPEIPEIPSDITPEEFLKKLRELIPELPEQEWKRIEERLKEIPEQEWKQIEERLKKTDETLKNG